MISIEFYRSRFTTGSTGNHVVIEEWWDDREMISDRLIGRVSYRDNVGFYFIPSIRSGPLNIEYLEKILQFLKEITGNKTREQGV